jgi:2-polyprenyl-3-methyl-5-hydroxy-6-metoxy-1,4-benzoquinol methylase
VDDRAADPALYHGYVEWKSWRGAFAANDREARYYAAEFEGIALSGKRVLEIGFGNGSFLAWARAQGATVAGTEAIDALVEQARTNGYDAQPADLPALAAAGRQFDIVVAFDVFEHWSRRELIAHLRQIHALLAHDGLVLARFPNGHSPFGRLHQHGDLTHVTALSSTSTTQLAQMTGFAVVRIENERRVSAKTDTWSRLKHRWRAYRRARIEVKLGKLYGFGRLPLDPNLTAVLRKVE